ncbi:unnamed protein product [Victoria cruziana]
MSLVLCYYSLRVVTNFLGESDQIHELVNMSSYYGKGRAAPSDAGGELIMMSIWGISNLLRAGKVMTPANLVSTWPGIAARCANFPLKLMGTGSINTVNLDCTRMNLGMLWLANGKPFSSPFRAGEESVLMENKSTPAGNAAYGAGEVLHGVNLKECQQVLAQDLAV